jgi:hypothetical protein
VPGTVKLAEDAGASVLLRMLLLQVAAGAAAAVGCRRERHICWLVNTAVACSHERADVSRLLLLL